MGPRPRPGLRPGTGGRASAGRGASDCGSEEGNDREDQRDPDQGLPRRDVEQRPETYPRRGPDTRPNASIGSGHADGASPVETPRRCHSSNSYFLTDGAAQLVAYVQSLNAF